MWGINDNLRMRKKTTASRTALWMQEGGLMAVGRISKAMVMVNAVTDPINRRYSVIYFEDAERNRYEYRFMESMTENSRSVFFKAVKPHEHIPALQWKNKKTVLHVSFRPGWVRYDPMAGRLIQQMIYPSFKAAEEADVEAERKPRVFQKYYCT